jgi:hypothetical protein
VPRTDEERRLWYRELEAKASEVEDLLKSVERSENESDLATLIDSNSILRTRITIAVRTIYGGGS